MDWYSFYGPEYISIWLVFIALPFALSVQHLVRCTIVAVRNEMLTADVPHWNCADWFSAHHLDQNGYDRKFTSTLEVSKPLHAVLVLVRFRFVATAAAAFFVSRSNLFSHLVVSSIFIKVIFELYHLHFYTIHCKPIFWPDITLTVHTLSHIRIQTHRFYWTHNFNEFFRILQTIKRDENIEFILCVYVRLRERQSECESVENIGILIIGEWLCTKSILWWRLPPLLTF